MKRCFLYPGQGAQYLNMGKDLWEAETQVKELFEQASEVCQMDLKGLIFDGTEERLAKTDVTQPAVTVVNLAARLCLNKAGLASDGCAGFSLGEYAALADAEVIGVEDLFKIVKHRGALMQKAADSHGVDQQAPGMAAVVGLPAKALEEALHGVDDIYLANYNSPRQTVLGGSAQGLAAAEDLCKAKGAKRFIRLKVSAPFHTPLLEEARIGLAETLETIKFKDPVKSLYSNVSGSRVKNGAEAKKLALSQVTEPVRWTAEEESIQADNYDQILEVGPGRILAGFWRSVADKPTCQPAGALAQIEALAQTKQSN